MPLRIPLGVWQAWRLMRRLRPEVVFSKGGFVSFPVVLGAWLNRIPVVAHESDLTPGLANRLAQPFVQSLCVNFAQTAARVRRLVATGTPIRRTLLEGDAERGRSRLGVAADRPVLLVVGGSLGAAKLNETVRAALGELLEHHAVVHICGAGKLEPGLNRPGYVQREYVDDGWGDIIAAADLGGLPGRRQRLVRVARSLQAAPPGAVAKDCEPWRSDRECGLRRAPGVEPRPAGT